MYIYNSLLRPVAMETQDACLWSDKFDYWITEDCKNLNPGNYNLIVLQWNIQSLMSNQNKLKQLLAKLEKKNTPVDVLLLCKTFLTTTLYDVHHK